MTAAPALRPAADPRLVRALGALAILVAWEAGARALAGTFLLAGPLDIGAYVVAHVGLLWRALLATLGAAALGFVAGNLAAVALAAGASLLPRAEGFVRAFALVVFCLPLVATGPILRVLWGPGIGPQVTLAALACSYTTLVPLLVGLRAAPQGWFDLVASYGRGRWTALAVVRAMASLPYLVAGLQIAAPAAVLGAMVGEFTGAERGLGVLAIRAMRGLDVTATWSIAALAAAASIAAYAAAGWLGAKAAPDRPTLILAAPSAAPGGSRWRALAGALLSALALLLLWQAAMDAFGLNRFFAKRPGDVWAFLVAAPDAAASRATLLAALEETMAFALPGYVAGLALGAGLAGLVVLFPLAAAVALPLGIALRSVPIVTTAPLIVLALGRGAGGTVAIVAAMIFFPTLVACLQGLRQAPGQVLDVFDSYAAGRWRTLLWARAPAMLPAFFAAARMAVPAAVLAVTVAEWLATGTGVGNLMALTASTSNYNMLWSATLLLTLASVAGYLLVETAERAVLARYAPEQVAR